MKYIFRYTILTFYTEEKNLSISDLESAIDQKFPYRDRIDGLVETFKEAIEQLITNKQ